MTSYASIVALLKTALLLLQLAQGPNVPQSLHDKAVLVANQAIAAATAALRTDTTTPQIVVTTTPAPSSNSSPAITPVTIPPPVVIPVTNPEPTVPSILVGFWSVGNMNIAGDYISQTASASNVAVIPPDETGQFLPRIKKAAALGLKSVLMVPWLLFDTNNNNGALLPDYQSRFDAMWNALGADQNNVVGFYLIDEPYHNNQGAGTNAIPESKLKANLDSAAAYIHQKARNRPVMLTEAYTMINRTDLATLFPASVDYFGVNCYLAFGDVCSESKTSAMIAKIIAVKLPNQKLIVTADGYWPTTPTAQNDANLRGRIEFWEDLLKPYLAAGQIGAFTPFIYQNAASDVHGVSEAPLALAELRRYMTSVRDGTPAPLVNLSRGKTVSASDVYLDNSAAKALDGDLTTGWNAGDFAPQWIQIDLGAPHSIQEIRLTIGQSPAGATTHSVYVKGEDSNAAWQLVSTFQGTTANGDQLEYVPPQAIGGIRYIKVETTASPSWVAWPEITAYGY